MVIPTLTGGARLRACLESLGRQSFRDFAIVVVQNGPDADVPEGMEVVRSPNNLGYGESVNEGARQSRGEFIAALNDDTVLEPDWLRWMVAAMDEHPRCAMVAPRILLGDGARMDSAGMLLARDGSSKQRGHLNDPENWSAAGPALLPSGCAALYRRAPFEEAGGFDASFFLYCEETDLGLRLRWMGWEAWYEPRAIVRHHYSQTAGAASISKAWYVERNRLRLVVKTLPWDWAAASFGFSAVRYFWHLAAFLRRRGKAGEFRASGGGGLALAGIALRAHLSLLAALPGLLRQRAEVRRRRRISAGEFKRAVRPYRIGLREVAAL